MSIKKIEMISVGWVVATTAFLTLFLELLLARFFLFYFGHAGSLFAIPFALIGMALGGLFQRMAFGERFGYGFYLRRFAEFSALGLILLFALGNTVLPPADDIGLMLEKTAIFGTLFLIPFFLGGFLLSRIFAEYRASIGRLYFADLASGAIACFMVPFLFHYLDAQPIIMIFLGVAFLSAAAVEPRRAYWPVGLFAIIIALTAFGIFFKEDPNLRGLWAIKATPQVAIKEMKKRWNEHSRVSLLAYSDVAKKGPTGYRIVQDDAVSNVYLTRYRPGTHLKPNALRYPESVPWILGMDVDEVLVLFAGCGKDMIVFDGLSRGRAKITGVELNPTIKEFCRDTPGIRQLGLREFYEKPNVNLVIAEGRNFLEQNKDEKYDVIFIAASGAPAANLKQASSRKYLETMEAYRQYEAHLRPGGLILFGYQKALYRLDTLKQLHAADSKEPFSKSIIIGEDFVAYKPTGFTDADLAGPLKDVRKNPKAYKYIPRSSKNRASIAKMVLSPIDEGNVMTDDRPFAYPIQLSSFSRKAFAAAKTGKGGWLPLNHQSRVIPVVFILLFVGIAFAIHRRFGKSEHRLKKSQIAYFMVTGFAYMCMEMGLIGKYDLFLGNPLYSMALITAVFLLANGLGSLWVDRLAKRFPLEVMAGAALATTLLTILTAETVIPHFIGLGLAAKIPLVLVMILPVGVALGMFFPYAISMKKDEPAFNASSAYGFSVLSSVLGGAYALAVMMNVGYQSLLLHSAGCYVLLLAGIFVSHRLLKNRVF